MALHYFKDRSSWQPKQPLFVSCFNWMVPNLYMENGCFYDNLYSDVFQRLEALSVQGLHSVYSPTFTP